MQRRVAAGMLAAVLSLLVLVGVGWQPLVDVDRSIDVEGHDLVVARPWLVDTARALTHLGDPLVVTVATLAVAVAAWLLGRRRTALYLLAVRVAAALLGGGLKEIVRRARPVLAHPVAHASGFSFPSGHALGSAALYASLAIAAANVCPAPLRWVLAGLLPVLVGTTRVLLGVHFPTDVVAGLLLGWSVAVIGAAVAWRPT